MMSSGASAATDMFAFGQTLNRDPVREACLEQSDGDDPPVAGQEEGREEQGGGEEGGGDRAVARQDEVQPGVAEEVAGAADNADNAPVKNESQKDISGRNGGVERGEGGKEMSTNARVDAHLLEMLISKLLAHESAQRPSAAQVLESPLFASVGAIAKVSVSECWVKEVQGDLIYICSGLCGCQAPAAWYIYMMMRLFFLGGGEGTVSHF